MPSYPNYPGTIDDHPQFDSNQFDQLAEGLTITYFSSIDKFHVTIDPDVEIPLHVAIIKAIEAITHSETDDLDPLLAYIDVDALEQLYNPRRYNSVPQPTVSFVYANFHITVESATDITISP